MKPYSLFSKLPLVWIAFSHAAEPQGLVQQYCVGCHSKSAKIGGLVLEGMDASRAGENQAVWERVLRQVRTGAMPPAGMPRPNKAAASAFANGLEETLDRVALAKADPGAPMPHRLNRVEYSNAIRDLTGIDVNPGALLPVDDSGNGFDNMADLLSMSPVLLERYIAAARTISRLVVADPKMEPVEQEYGSRSRSGRVEPDAEDLPLGARGGVVFKHYFPLDAEYEIRTGLLGGGDESTATPFKFRTAVKAGLHTVTVTFAKESARAEVASPNVQRRPGGPAADAGTAEMDLRIDGVRLKRFQVPQRGGAPDVGPVVVAGPWNVTGRGDTLSRTKIFICKPLDVAQEDACANKIFNNLAGRAFRRTATAADVRPLLRFYKQGRSKGGDFEQGVQEALQALLVSPEFLFRVERDPRGAAPDSVYRLSDFDLASRLSFFLWSSIPDDELLKLSAEGKLSSPAVRKQQMRRMLADPKSSALISNFGGQWLFLRTLANSKPDPDVFSGFDESLRQAFQKETLLFLGSIFREDRSVLDLLSANYTFLNQRLASHYKIPNVYGSHFRKVELTDQNRGGLLGQGSILTVSSYPNRTSVVLRGKWILENLLGTPPPPAPADVPELKPKAHDGKPRSLRDAMQEHRANAICAGCHARMDPIGFALENFNGVGEWRSEDGGAKIDASGKLPDGSTFSGPAGLRQLLLEHHKDEFVETFTEKLLTYALGRGIEPADKPAVRAIARAAANENYRVSAFLNAILDSVPFQMRRASPK